VEDWGWLEFEMNLKFEIQEFWAKNGLIYSIFDTPLTK
jgi:hypothetical protein